MYTNLHVNINLSTLCLLRSFLEAIAPSSKNIYVVFSFVESQPDLKEQEPCL